MRMLRRSAVFFGLAFALLPAAAAAAALTPVDRASVQLGFSIPSFDTTVRADGETQGGTPVDLERDLDLDNDDLVGSLGFTWRPWENHEFSLNYFNDEADSTRQLTRDIVFDDVVYEVDSTVRARFDVDAWDIGYVWWAKHETTWALGPRLGLVYYDIDLGIELELDANGDPVAADVSSEVSPKLPAPVIGGSWHWVPADQWRVKVDVGYFSLSMSDIDGSILYASGALEWFPWDEWGFTLNYTVRDADVDADAERFTGDLDFTGSNATLGVIYRF